MFAFAVWDRSRRELFCARDRFASSPSTTRWQAGGSASRRRSRRCSPIPRCRASRTMRASSTSSRVGLPTTPRRRCSTGSTSSHRAPPCGSREGRGWLGRPAGTEPQPANLDGRPASEVVRELLTDAVSLRLRSDVPVGTLLSGGLDSSSVTALASLLRRAEGADPPGVVHLTLPRSSNRRGSVCDERARGDGLSQPRESCRTSSGLLQELDRVLWHMDEPFHTASLYGHWKLMELTRKAGITVLLDGRAVTRPSSAITSFFIRRSTSRSVARDACSQAAQELAWRRRRNGVSLRHSASEALRVALPHRVRAAPEAILDQPGAPDSASTTPAADAPRAISCLGSRSHRCRCTTTKRTATPWASRSRPEIRFSTTGSFECGLALDSRRSLAAGVVQVGRAGGDARHPPLGDRRPLRTSRASRRTRPTGCAEGELGSEIEAVVPVEELRCATLLQARTRCSRCWPPTAEVRSSRSTSGAPSSSSAGSGSSSIRRGFSRPSGTRLPCAPGTT